MSAIGVSILTNPHPCHHIVYPYTDEKRIAKAVNVFASSGLSKEESVVLIMADSHCEPITQMLIAEGFDFPALQSAGRLSWISAEELLHTLMVNGLPDEKVFQATVGEIIRRAQASSPVGKVRMVGEMVGLLLNAKNLAAAERMEELWNEMVEACSVALLCTYVLDGVKHTALPYSLTRLHSHAFHTDELTVEASHA